MLTPKKAVKIVGALFLVQLFTAIISYSVILEPILQSSSYLADIFEHITRVKVAMVLDLVCGAAITGIAVLLYPILKTYSERIAIWYVGLRVIEFMTIIVSGVFLLTLTSISKKYIEPVILDQTNFEMMGNIVLSCRGWTQNMTLIVYSLGASLFYYLLFKSKLIPRFISVWGLIAVAMLFTEIMLNTFGKGFGMLVMMPMGLNEIFLGFWLLVKGIKLSKVRPDSE